MRRMYELRLCNDTYYYLYFDNELIVPYVEFDKFNKECAVKMCDLLNEQQATISQLKEENEQLRQSVEYWQKKYEEGTETLEIGEQQATIQSLNDENEQLQKKLMIVSAHLLSDECNLTESQIKNIIKEMENV